MIPKKNPKDPEKSQSKSLLKEKGEKIYTCTTIIQKRQNTITESKSSERIFCQKTHRKKQRKKM